jgi:hypothetical protein
VKRTFVLFATILTLVLGTVPLRAHSVAASENPEPRATAARPAPCDLKGKVQFVDSFPDYKIQIVDSFPDIKVQKVTSFPDSAGKWQIVDSFPDFKVQVVDSFPDLKVQYVDSFPGCP